MLGDGTGTIADEVVAGAVPVVAVVMVLVVVAPAAGVNTGAVVDVVDVVVDAVGNVLLAGAGVGAGAAAGGVVEEAGAGKVSASASCATACPANDKPSSKALKATVIRALVLMSPTSLFINSYF